MISTCQKSAGNAACLASQRCEKSSVRNSTGLMQLQESAEKLTGGVQVRNTFIDGGLSRSSSFEDFFQERELLSCPSRHMGRVNGFLKKLDVGDEESSSSDGQTSTQTPSRGTPSHDTPSSSSCKNVHCDDIEDYSAQPWYGLASPFDTPVDRHSFSVASSLQNHVRMLEELAQSQKQVPVHAQVVQQPPALTVHHLSPALSQMPQLEPEHPTRRTLLCLDDVIEETAGPALIDHSSSFGPQSSSPPTSTEPNGMPVVPPNLGYVIFAPASQPIDTHSRAFPPAAPNLLSFTMPVHDANHSSISCGVEVVDHGNELPNFGLEMRIPAPPSGPALGSQDLPSVGSAGHAAGRCKPCAFFHNRGCENGVVCEFCHLCEPGEKKRRQKEKINNKRTFKHAATLAN